MYAMAPTARFSSQKETGGPQRESAGQIFRHRGGEGGDQKFRRTVTAHSRGRPGAFQAKPMTGMKLRSAFER